MVALQGSADVPTNKTLASGIAGGGSFDCGAALSPAVQPSMGAGDYWSVNITVLGS
jgi:hypothetical protein